MIVLKKTQIVIN